MDLAATLGVLTQVAPTPPPQNTQDWKQTVSWVLGLPVLLAACGGTLYAVPKIRRENRKLDLEILEKERALGIARESNNSAELARIVAEPIFENRRAADLILRFVLLSLVVQAWDLVSSLFGAALSGAQIGLSRALEGDASIWPVVGSLTVAIVASLPSIVGSLLFVGIGWPLLIDIAKLLRFELPAFLYTDGTRRVLIAIAVIAALGRNLVPASLSLSRF